MKLSRGVILTEYYNAHFTRITYMHSFYKVLCLHFALSVVVNSMLQTTLLVSFSMQFNTHLG